MHTGLPPFSWGALVRVTIEHSQGQLVPFFTDPFFLVCMTIIFSEEEKAIVKHRNLKNVLLIPVPPSEVSIYTIGHFAKGSPLARKFPNLIEAKAFESELREKYLPTLKVYLDGSRDLKNSDTFEM